MKRSYIIALLFALATLGWIASGQFGDNKAAPVVEKGPAKLEAAASVPAVRVSDSHAQAHVRQAKLQGHSEARRSVDIKAEISGRVEALLVDEGESVVYGDPIVRLAREDRAAALKEAEALLQQRRIEFDAARRLNQKGFKAETELASAEADLRAAEALVERANLALEKTSILAPIDGVVSQKWVEVGSFLEPGSEVLRIMDMNPMLIVGEVSERNVGKLKRGRVAQARLSDGREVTGKIVYIAPAANSETRTFKVEIEIPNEGRTIADGMTAEIFVPLEPVSAHFVSPALLTLNDEGLVGVRAVGEDQRVIFYPVSIVAEAIDGVWLTGLPEVATLITVGQEYVQHGELVDPVFEAGTFNRASGQNQ